MNERERGYIVIQPNKKRQTRDLVWFHRCQNPTHIKSAPIHPIPTQSIIYIKSKMDVR